MTSLNFPEQDAQQNAKTVEQMVGSLLIQGAGYLRLLRDAKAAWEAGDEAALRSVFSMVDTPGSESGGGYDNLRMLDRRVRERALRGGLRRAPDWYVGPTTDAAYCFRCGKYR